MEPTMGDGAEELLHTYTEDGGINYLAAAAMLPVALCHRRRLRRVDEPDVPRFSRRTAGGFERSAASDHEADCGICTRD